MSEVIQLRDTVFVEGHAWWPSYATGLRNSTIYLGRMRWTTGDPMLEQVDCEAGAMWMHSVDGRLRGFRQPATGQSDPTLRLAMSSTFGAIHHPDDHDNNFPGTPIARHGDLAIGDFEDAGDRFIFAVDDVRGYFSLSCQAQFRDAATELAPLQPSDRIRLRASSWDASDSVARTRDFNLRTSVLTAVDSGDQWYMGISYDSEGGSEIEGWRLYAGASNIPTTEFRYPTGGLHQFLIGTAGTAGAAGTGVATFALRGGENDDVEISFGHLGTNKRARWRFYHGQGRNDLGSAAELLSVNYSKDADGSVTMRHSGAFGHRMSYWDGAAHTIGFYTQGVLDSVAPTGRFRLLSNFGAGTLDFDQDGNLTLSGTVATVSDPWRDSPILSLLGSYDDDGATPAGFRATTVMDSDDPSGHLHVSNSMGDGVFDFHEDGSFEILAKGSSLGALKYFDDASGGFPTAQSPAFGTVGKSWDGAASVERMMGFYTAIDAAANAGDLWSWRLNNGTDDVLTFMQSAAASLVGSITLASGSAFGAAASLSLAPSYFGAFTLDLHAYMAIVNPTLSGTTLTDAVVCVFDAAAGTHKAIDAGTTKTSPGNVTAWRKDLIDGVIYYTPMYTSKTA